MTEVSTVNHIDRPSRSAFSQWAGLAFFAFILLGPIFDSDAGLREWGRDVAVIVISVAIFLLSARRRWAYGGAAALMAVALVATVLGSSAMSVLPIYAAGLIAMHGNRRQLIPALTVLTVLTVAGFAISPIPWPYRMFLLLPVIMLWIVGLSVSEDASLVAHADVLQAENRRIEHLARMTERERIARDLHDLVGHALTAITLHSRLIQRLAGSDPDQTIEEAASVEAMARDALSSMRTTVSGWHYASLPDELEVATKSLRAAGAVVDTQGDWKIDLAPTVETVMALALREAVTNVIRHANAEQVVLRLEAPDGGVRMTVTDDGVGRGSNEGSGLRGMRERVVAAGGSLTLAGSAGTTLTIDMPFGAGRPA